MTHLAWTYMTLFLKSYTEIKEFKLFFSFIDYKTLSRLNLK